MAAIFAPMFRSGAAIFADQFNAVSVAPQITQQPAGQSATVGGSATFSVVATGSGTLTYQWRRNGVTIPGAVASIYTLNGLTLDDNGAQFDVVVHGDTAPDATSNAATLTVTAATSSRFIAALLRAVRG